MSLSLVWFGCRVRLLLRFVFVSDVVDAVAADGATAVAAVDVMLCVDASDELVFMTMLLVR